MTEEIRVDTIKAHQELAGYVVVCVDEGGPVLATHRLFTRLIDAVAYAGTVHPSRQAVVFQLRKEKPDDWRPGEATRDG